MRHIQNKNFLICLMIFMMFIISGCDALKYEKVYENDEGTIVYLDKNSITYDKDNDIAKYVTKVVLSDKSRSTLSEYWKKNINTEKDPYPETNYIITATEMKLRTKQVRTKENIYMDKNDKIILQKVIDHPSWIRLDPNKTNSLKVYDFITKKLKIENPQAIQAKVDLITNAGSLVDKFHELGARSFEEKYKDKKVKLSGQLVEKGQDNIGQFYFILYSDRRGTVVANFPLNDGSYTKQSFNSVKTGDIVEIMGTIDKTGVEFAGPRKFINIEDIELIK